LDKIWPQLNIEVVYNLKTKSSGIILTPWAMFVPILAFLLFLVFEVACGEECARLFLQILPQIKPIFPEI